MLFFLFYSFNKLTYIYIKTPKKKTQINYMWEIVNQILSIYQ